VETYGDTSSALVSLYTCNLIIIIDHLILTTSPIYIHVSQVNQMSHFPRPHAHQG
jgi:hypothetical protein